MPAIVTLILSGHEAFGKFLHCPDAANERGGPEIPVLELMCCQMCGGMPASVRIRLGSAHII